jgi:hypothetical protein
MTWWIVHSDAAAIAAEEKAIRDVHSSCFAAGVYCV